MRGSPTGSTGVRTGPGGIGLPDGFPELIFARRAGQAELLLMNDGVVPVHFTDGSGLLPTVLDTTSALAVCDLENDTVPEILLGNGDVNSLFAESDRVLRFAGGIFTDADTALGFDFTGPSGVAADVPEGGVTEEIECGDLDGDGSVDIVAYGNIGSQKNWLFFRQ